MLFELLAWTFIQCIMYMFIRSSWLISHETGYCLLYNTLCSFFPHPCSFCTVSSYYRSMFTCFQWYIFISIDNHNMRSIYIILTVLPDCVINSANVCPSVCVYFCQSTIEHLGYKELTLDIQIYINMSFEISSYNVTWPFALATSFHF